MSEGRDSVMRSRAEESSAGDGDGSATGEILARMNESVAERDSYIAGDPGSFVLAALLRW